MVKHRATYQAYKNMIYRCTNTFYNRYKDYGGRGITVCERWLLGYEYFIEDMGNRPSPLHSIDRIDNELGYYGENCRWTTRDIQMNNKRQTIIYPEETIEFVKAEILKGTPSRKIQTMCEMSLGGINHYKYKLSGIKYRHRSKK